MSKSLAWGPSQLPFPAVFSAGAKAIRKGWRLCFLLEGKKPGCLWLGGFAQISGCAPPVDRVCGVLLVCAYDSNNMCGLMLLSYCPQPRKALVPRLLPRLPALGSPGSSSLHLDGHHTPTPSYLHTGPPEEAASHSRASLVPTVSFPQRLTRCQESRRHGRVFVGWVRELLS